MSDLFIPVLLGTNRQGRESEKAANFMIQELEKLQNVKTKLIDVRDLNLEITQGTALRDKNPEFRDTMASADGLIIVSPEYNHGYPGILKSALDVLYEEYFHKVVGVVAVSNGPFGGARMTEALVSVLKALGFVTIKYDVNFWNVAEVIDQELNLVDEKIRKRTDGFLHELVWMTSVLQKGRKEIPYEK